MVLQASSELEQVRHNGILLLSKQFYSRLNLISKRPSSLDRPHGMAIIALRTQQETRHRAARTSS